MTVVKILPVRAFTTLIVALSLGWMIGCRGPSGPDGTDSTLLDSLPPEIEWLAPVAATVIDSIATFEVRALDRAINADGQIVDILAWKVAFFVGGTEFSGVLVDSTNKIYRYEWNATHYPETDYPLQARVWDLARNHTDTPVVMVTVEH